VIDAQHRPVSQWTVARAVHAGRQETDHPSAGELPPDHSGKLGARRILVVPDDRDEAGAGK